MRRLADMCSESIKVLVATHKPYRMPDDPMYLPIHVGKALSKEDSNFIGDDTGENISQKNPFYCELTALYWAWKNLDADYIGLVHYRRHFVYERAGNRWDSILTSNQVRRILPTADVILPHRRKYYVETVYDHYAHAHPVGPLDCALSVIRRDYPEYDKSIDVVMRRRWAYLFNMFIMPIGVFHEYCAWLFPILEQVEEVIDTDGYSDQDKRVYGFLAERLFNIWLDYNTYNTVELRYVFMEHQNWLLKGGKFLERKFKRGNK